MNGFSGGNPDDRRRLVGDVDRANEVLDDSTDGGVFGVHDDEVGSGRPEPVSLHTTRQYGEATRPAVPWRE